MKIRDYLTEAKELNKNVKQDIVGKALQVVFETPNWGKEHTSAMFDVINNPKFEYEDLEDIVLAADKLKKKGFSKSGAKELLMKITGRPSEIFHTIHKATR